jgi:hypothetical protein
MEVHEVETARAQRRHVGIERVDAAVRPPDSAPVSVLRWIAWQLALLASPEAKHCATITDVVLVTIALAMRMS